MGHGSRCPPTYYSTVWLVRVRLSVVVYCTKAEELVGGCRWVGICLYKESMVCIAAIPDDSASRAGLDFILV